jgi:hypothetical protein
MDEVAYSLLEKMQLKNAKLLPLADFEDDALRKAKQDRSVAEYCWTCAAPLIRFVMRQESQVTHVAYLDADLFFYSSPDPIYQELGDDSILIIGHRFSPQYKVLEKTSGIYNVSMIIFKKDPHGLECLDWWIDQVLRACYLDPEAGLCGDQKYLDDWPSRFRKVVVLQHKGGGMAPWNIANYRLSKKSGLIYMDSDELIFYHFHSLQLVKWRILNKRIFLAAKGYRFTRKQLELVYSPYVRQLRTVMNEVERLSPGFSCGFTALNWRDALYAFRYRNLVFA